MRTACGVCPRGYTLARHVAWAWDCGSWVGVWLVWLKVPGDSSVPHFLFRLGAHLEPLCLIV